MARLLAALHDCRDPLAANAVRLLLLTGARRGELLSARWADIDFAAGVWTKPGTTTKQKTAHIIPLSQAVIAVLTAMRKEAGDREWIFPASRGGRPRRDLGENWDQIRKAAAIPDVRLHDLRHTYASALASAGTSLRIVGGLLGHAQPGTTQRYAHLVDSALREATEKASDLIVGPRFTVT
ncbi:MAG TPA: site-specific integrase [Xanthobacteraceae bacterium]|nr:site-specific integrase [Xanthobacteraceae bacterium]